MYLRQIAPPSLKLNTWIQSPVQPRLWFVISTVEGAAAIRMSERPVARTPLVQVYDLLNVDDDSVGALIKHRPMQVSVGHHYLSLGTVPEGDTVKVAHWQGDWVSLLEGPNGATLFHHCEVPCRTSRALTAL